MHSAVQRNSLMKNAIRIAITGFLFLLAGCSTGATSQVDPNQLNTMVAATVDSALAATRTASLQSAGTPTPAPSATQEALATATSQPATAVPAETGMNLQIAFTDGQGNLWYWKSGSNPLQLTNGSDAADFSLSPDGSQVLFTRLAYSTEYSLWLIGTDGSAEQQVMSADEFAALPRPAAASSTAPAQLGWVPDSHTAAFNTRRVYEGPGLDMSNDLYLVDSDTGEATRLLDAGKGGGMFFYSPDGSQIALVNPNQIDLINSDGSNRRPAVLTYENVLMYTEAPFYAQPVWSADGKKLRVIVPASDRLGKPEDPSSVWEIPAAGGKAVKLLDFHLNGLGPGASISPDLRLLAYFQNIATGGQQDLHIASLDGGLDQIYATGALNWVAWTDDSQGFIWTQYGQVGSGRPTFLGRLGQTPIQLGAPQAPFDLVWVEGDRFLFLDNDGGTPPAWSLYLGTIGGPNQLVAGLPAGDAFPKFEFVKSK
jgi:Tol biopolymer transport system component